MTSLSGMLLVYYHQVSNYRTMETLLYSWTCCSFDRLHELKRHKDHARWDSIRDSCNVITRFAVLCEKDVLDETRVLHLAGPAFRVFYCQATIRY